MSRLEFLFPHQRNMFNVDVLFNDKSSADCFENRVTIEDVVSGVVSCRLNEKFELNLSDFSNDPGTYIHYNPDKYALNSMNVKESMVIYYDE